MATTQSFREAVAPFVGADSRVLKELFSSHGDTAIFLVMDTRGTKYSLIRAFTLGCLNKVADIHVSVDHSDLTAHQLLLELVTVD
jgi:hypothetical protein